MTQDPVTPAQETITCSMLAAMLACGAATYAIISMFHINSLLGYATLVTASFVTIGYLTPHLTAVWIGRPLDDILNEHKPNPVEDHESIDTP